MTIILIAFLSFFLVPRRLVVTRQAFTPGTNSSGVADHGLGTSDGDWLGKQKLLRKSMDWFSRENLEPETIDFPIKIMGFSG